MSEIIDRESEKERLKQYSAKRSLLAFRNTAEQVNQPLKPRQLWRYTPTKIMTLATDGNLYSLNGQRVVKLQVYEQPLDKGWIAEEIAPIMKEDATQIQSVQRQMEEQRKQYLETFQNALPHERTDIRLKAEMDETFEEYMKTEEFKREQENMDAWFEQQEKEQLEREKQGLIELF